MKIFVLRFPEPCKISFLNIGQCMLSLSGHKSNTKSTGPILLKFTQNLYFRSKRSSKTYFEQFKKIIPPFC